MEVHMKKYLVLTVLLALLATPLLAQDANYPHSRGQMPMMSQKQFQQGHNMKQGPEGKGQQMGFPFWMAEELELTEDQIEKIDDYQDDSRKVSIDLKADINKLQIDERNALEDENYKEARKVIDQIYQKKATLAKELITLKEKISSVLTEDQKDMIKVLHKQKMQGPSRQKPKIGK